MHPGQLLADNLTICLVILCYLHTAFWCRPLPVSVHHQGRDVPVLSLVTAEVGAVVKDSAGEPVAVLDIRVRSPFTLQGASMNVLATCHRLSSLASQITKCLVRHHCHDHGCFRFYDQSGWKPPVLLVGCLEADCSLAMQMGCGGMTRPLKQFRKPGWIHHALCSYSSRCTLLAQTMATS